MKHNRRIFDTIRSDIEYFIDQHKKAEKLTNPEQIYLVNRAIYDLKTGQINQLHK